MADVIDITNRGAKLDFDADMTLDSLKGKLQAFVLTGYDLDGNELVAVTFGHLPEAVWALERAKKQLLERADVE